MQAAKVLSCGHMYHLGCLRDWLQQSGTDNFTCPICRTPLFVKRQAHPGIAPSAFSLLCYIHNFMWPAMPLFAHHRFASQSLAVQRIYGRMLLESCSSDVSCVLAYNSQQCKVWRLEAACMCSCPKIHCNCSGCLQVQLNIGCPLELGCQAYQLCGDLLHMHTLTTLLATATDQLPQLDGVDQTFMSRLQPCQWMSQLGRSSDYHRGINSFPHRVHKSNSQD